MNPYILTNIQVRFLSLIKLKIIIQPQRTGNFNLPNCYTGLQVHPIPSPSGPIWQERPKDK